MEKMASPGRGGHDLARAAGEAAFTCRERAAELFNVDNPENVIFTFNATHGLNIAIRSVVKPGMRVVVSGYEHNSVIRPLKGAGAIIDVASSELFEPEMAMAAFERKIDNGADAVVLNHVSNVFGYILPAERIAKLCKIKGIPFILDASQSAGSVEVDMKKLGADFIAMPGHKGLYGPQGSGLLLCGREPETFLMGGSGSESMSPDMPEFLPDRLEAGTHNMPGIAGLSEGLNFVKLAGVTNVLNEEKKLVSLMADGLKMIPGVRVFASDHLFSQAGVLSFSVRGMHPEEVGMKLNEYGIAVRAGLHCSPVAHRTVDTLPYGTVRASVSCFTKKKDIWALLNAMEEISKK